MCGSILFMKQINTIGQRTVLRKMPLITGAQFDLLPATSDIFVNDNNNDNDEEMPLVHHNDNEND